MTSKWKHLFVVFTLDVLILALLVFYKFNFIFPDHNQFIFSGDFIRPITLESLIKYYIYPFFLNEHGMFVDPTAIIRMPYWSLVTLVSHIVPLNVCYWLLIVVTQILSGLLISTSSRTLFSPEKKYSYYIIPLIPAIFVIFSYPINYRPYWLFLPLLPGLLQCVLIISYKTLTNHKLGVWTKLLLVLIGYLAILQVHNIIFILITLTFSFFVIILLVKKRLTIIKDYLSITFWLSLPLLLYIIPTIMMAFFSGQLPSPSYVYSYTVLEFMSSNANFVNAFTFNVGFWEKIVYTNLDKLITLLIVSFVVMLYSLTIIKKRKPFLLAVLLSFVIFLSLQLGINNPVYKLLADPSSQFAWLLRDPFKFSLVSLGLFTTIFTFAVNHLSTKIILKDRKALIASFLVVLVIFSVTVWSPSTKTLETIQPSTIPEEYFTATDYLNRNTKGPLIFLPIDGENYTWTDNPYLQGSFLARSYQGEYIDYTITNSKEVKEVLTYAACTENPEVLSLVTSGVIVDSSMEGRGSCFDKMAYYILSNYTEDIVKLGDYLYFLPNEEYSRFRISRGPLYLMASTDYTYLGSLGKFLNMDQGVVFFDDFEWLLRNANTEEIKLSSKVTEPSVAWSLGYTCDPLHGVWHPYLKRFSLKNWQSDYGKGLVFTWAPLAVPEDIQPTNDDSIKQWNFDIGEEFFEWKNTTPEKQFNAIHELKLEQGSIKATLWNSTWGWKTIKSPLILAKENNAYRFSFKIKGENSYKIHAKAIEYNSSKKIIGGKIVKSDIGSGNFDWKTITFDYISENENFSYIQLQIWHGHETEQPLPNVVWIDDVKVYDITKYAKPVILEIPFSGDDPDNYKLLIRYFENQKGGEIKVCLDGKPITIKTKDQLNKFVWRDLGTFHLEKGEHEIVLENVKGFNAVNLFALISEKEYYKAKQEVERILQNKTIIYLFESESDLYNENANVEKNDEASNGELLTLSPNGKARQEFEVIKDGYYNFAIRGRGNFEAAIDNLTFSIASNNFNFFYLDPVYLKKGLHKITIKPKMSLQPLTWSFENENDVDEWKKTTPENQWNAKYIVGWDKNEKALRVELYNSTWGWKIISSPLIPVKYGVNYTFNFWVKAKNGHDVHFKITEFNSSKQYIGCVYTSRIGDGSFDWKNITFDYIPENENVSYIRLQIWHGHETEQPLPNIIWIKNVTICEYQPVYIDVIWIYSVNSSNFNATLEDLFKVNEAPAKVVNYTKINPTLWNVKINATKPFMLSFANSYDPLWVAYVDGTEYQPVPLYSVINGFWINKTGDLEIVLRYKPQDWFEIGSIISIITLIGCMGYLLYDWKKNDERIKMIKRKIYTILKKKK